MICDSSITIELLSNPENVHLFRELSTERLFLSAVTMAETTGVATRRGLSASRARITCQNIGIVLPVTESIAARAGELHTHIRKTRTKFSMIDALILATAHEHKMPLVTFDTDFRGLHGVRILKRKQ